MTILQLKYVIAIDEECSMRKAADRLYVSQPGLSSAVRDLENELGIQIFERVHNGVVTTSAGASFIAYARHAVEQFEIIENKYLDAVKEKPSFSVSMQHYTFAVNAFMSVIEQYGMDEYEFEVHETRTYDVIDNVRNMKSEIGVLYMNDYNRTVLQKILRDAGLKFTPLFDCSIYAYMSKSNPLAEKKQITMKDLDKYPCLAFSQGEHNSFYFAEEVLSTYEYKRLIRVSDRATILNMMIGLNGYTLCSGIICEDLNGTDYCAVKLKTKEKMTIGYISRKHSKLSEMGQKYIEELSKYKEKVLD